MEQNQKFGPGPRSGAGPRPTWPTRYLTRSARARSRVGPSAWEPTRCPLRRGPRSVGGTAPPPRTTPTPLRRAGHSPGTRWAAVRREDRGRERRPRRGPGVQADHGVGVLTGVEEAVPVAGEDGRVAELGGKLGKADGLEAQRRVAPYLPSGEVRIGQPGQLQGDDAVRVRAGPALPVPQFQARMQARPSSASSARENTAPQKPATRDGKHSDAQMPAMSMSRMRSSMSRHPVRPR